MRFAETFYRASRPRHGRILTLALSKSSEGAEIDAWRPSAGNCARDTHTGVITQHVKRCTSVHNTRRTNKLNQSGETSLRVLGPARPGSPGSTRSRAQWRAVGAA